jgi:hypothetical protein
MKILFRAYFHQKNFRKKLAGSGRFQKSDPDPVKNRPDPKHSQKALNVFAAQKTY